MVSGMLISLLEPEVGSVEMHLYYPARTEAATAPFFLPPDS